MELIPVEIGPLNPHVQDMAVAAVLFAAGYFAITRLLREQATEGVARHAEEVRAQAEAKREEAHALLAEARHDAAQIRQRAHAQGAALIATARADAVRRRDGLLAEAGARIEAERAAAEAELRPHVSELAAQLASRVVGEPISPPSRTPAADTR